MLLETQYEIKVRKESNNKKWTTKQSKDKMKKKTKNSGKEGRPTLHWLILVTRYGTKYSVKD